jgi:predicted GH43/DUF377 family glycosyl hydrolase
MKNATNLFTRSDANPLFTADDLPYTANSVFNPGAVRANGETLLIMRAEGFTGQSHFVVARSADGISNWRVDPDHDLLPDPLRHPEDRFGIEDARIVEIPELAAFYVTFTSYSAEGPVVSLAKTKDFHHFERLGIICPAHDKDAALFPRRFDGDWLLIHRPTRDFNLSTSRSMRSLDRFGRRLTGRPQHSEFANICLSHSHDLLTWDQTVRLIAARDGGWWDAQKVGLGPPPLETSEGWLILYHGVRITGSGCLYRSGLALLDLTDPTKILARGNEFILGPETLYERTGDVPNVVFPSGWVLDPNGHTVRVYYGAADSSVCMATGEIPELLEYLHHTSSDSQVPLANQ